MSKVLPLERWKSSRYQSAKHSATRSQMKRILSMKKWTFFFSKYWAYLAWERYSPRLNRYCEVWFWWLEFFLNAKTKIFDVSPSKAFSRRTVSPIESTKEKCTITFTRTCSQTVVWYKVFQDDSSFLIFRRFQCRYGERKSDQTLSLKTSGIKSGKLSLLRSGWKSKSALWNNAKVGTNFKMRGKQLIQSGSSVQYLKRTWDDNHITSFISCVYIHC